MLKKQFRLTKQKDFEKMRMQGAFFSDGFLVLKAARNDLTYSRFGFVVSSKISKSAAGRNKIKRRLREAVRSFQPEVRKGFDLLFIAKKNIKEKEFEEINTIVEKLLKRCGLIKK